MTAVVCWWLRLLQGVGQPDEVLECVAAGVDLFEAFFPFQVTERGCALCFSFVIYPDPERAGTAPSAGVVIGFKTLTPFGGKQVSFNLFNLINYKLWIYSESQEKLIDF